MTVPKSRFVSLAEPETPEQGPVSPRIGAPPEPPKPQALAAPSASLGQNPTAPDTMSMVYLSQPEGWEKKYHTRLLADESKLAEPILAIFKEFRAVWDANFNDTVWGCERAVKELEQKLRGTPPENRPAVEAEIARAKGLSGTSKSLAGEAIAAVFMKLQEPLRAFVTAAHKRVDSYAGQHATVEKQAAELLGVTVETTPHRRGVASLHKSLDAVVAYFTNQINRSHPLLRVIQAEPLETWFKSAK